MGIKRGSINLPTDGDPRPTFPSTPSEDDDSDDGEE